MSEGKRDYEIAFLLKNPESEKELAAVLSKNGADFLYQKPAAELKLAYPIEKHVSAWFGFYHFKINPENVKLIKGELTLNPNVLRSLIITPPVQVSNPLGQQVRPDRKPTTVLSNEALEEKIHEFK